jgi:hypothetical protein
MQKKVRQRGWWKTVSKGLTGREKMQGRARVLIQKWRVVQRTTG